jgi:hypothetical protein
LRRPRTGGAFSWGSLALACAAAWLLAGCAVPVAFTAVPGDPAQLDCAPGLAFLAEPGTTRDEVTLRLGPPSSSYEGERIAIYPLVRDARGRFHVTTRDVALALSSQAAGVSPHRTDLVLVFGADGVLARRALVEREQR